MLDFDRIPRSEASVTVLPPEVVIPWGSGLRSLARVPPFGTIL